MIEIPQYEIPDAFPSEEGLVDVIYGLIRSGKTYLATAKIHEEIAQGHVVYATWPIKLTDTDDRHDLFFLLRGLFLPWKKRFFYIPAEKNFHYINVSEGTVNGVQTFLPNDNEAFIRYCNSLSHCSLYIDEAWRVLSHQLVGSKNIAQVFDLILVTGHKFRKVTLITQRTMNVNPTARAQVGRFFKCEKLGSMFGIPRFMLSEYQEMKGEDVIDDDDELHPPISRQTYWGKRKIFDSYNSWFYGDEKPLHVASYTAYDLTYRERLRNMTNLLFRRKTPLAERAREVRGVERSEGGKGTQGEQKNAVGVFCEGFPPPSTDLASDWSEMSHGGPSGKRTPTPYIRQSEGKGVIHNVIHIPISENRRRITVQHTKTA